MNSPSPSVFKFYIFSFIFIAILGTLLHFTYEWSNENLLVASFSAINESTWEHLKSLFFPMLITTIVGYFFVGKDFSNFLCSRVIAVIIGMLFIVVFFYTYTGILGYNIAFLDISSFFVAILLSEYISYKVLYSNCCKYNFICGLIFIILLILFVIFTYTPPKINLFKDPLTNTYGIYKT